MACSALYIDLFCGPRDWTLGLRECWATSSYCTSTCSNPLNLVSNILIQSFRTTLTLHAKMHQKYYMKLQDTEINNSPPSKGEFWSICFVFATTHSVVRFREEIFARATS